MIFEWDESKRESTFTDREPDFADTPLFFDGRPAVTKIEGSYYTLVWAWRGEAIPDHFDEASP